MRLKCVGGALDRTMWDLQGMYLEQALLFPHNVLMYDRYEPRIVDGQMILQYVGQFYGGTVHPNRDDFNETRFSEFMERFWALCDEYGAEFCNGAYAEDHAEFRIGKQYREIDRWSWDRRHDDE